MKKAILLIILALLFGMSAFAEISLDGDFTDWQDKPMIEAEQEPTPPDPVSITEPESTEPAQSNTAQDTENPDTPAVTENDTALQQLPETSSSPQDSDRTEFAQPAAADQVIEDALDVISEPNTLQTQENEEMGNGPKFKVHQLRWHIAEEDNILYIMARLSHPPDLDTGSFTTHFITDFGEYDAVTSYDTRDGSVLSTLNGISIANIKGSCNVVNKNTVEVEYGIPLTMLVGDMQWGYLIKFKVLTEDDEEPKNSYITISTASTMPYVGVGICVALGIGVPYLIKRKKKQ